MKPPWRISEGLSPVVATAIHHGHDLRPQVRDCIALGDAERLREEDPHTGEWTAIAPTRIVVERSRFEFDLNRPNSKCVYLAPAEAWGLRVWRSPLSRASLEISRSLHKAFYQRVGGLLEERIRQWGYVFVIDLHSYNHRRRGAHAPPEPAADNPDVNIGTGTLQRELWAPLVERFADALRDATGGRCVLDVRENVRFQGGYFPRWVHGTFSGAGCALAVEVKKFFMDEWTGKANARDIASVAAALGAAVDAVTVSGQRLRPQFVPRGLRQRAASH